MRGMSTSLTGSLGDSTPVTGNVVFQNEGRARSLEFAPGDGRGRSHADCPAGAGLYHLAITVHANRGFHLVWFNRSTKETHDRALFDEMLASVAFP